MHQIIRIVVNSGDRKATCYLAQAHPYFFRETDSARVHVYLEKQVERLGGELTMMEFHALFSATLEAMHGAGDRLSMQDRLYFLIHLAARVTQLGDNSFSSTNHLLLTIAAAGKSLQLDAALGMDLFLFLMAGYSSIPGANPARANGFYLRPFQAALLEECEQFPTAEKQALTLLSGMLTTNLDAAYVDDALAHTANWPSAWRTCLLLCVSNRLVSCPESTRLALLAKLFGAMSGLPDEQRDAVLRPVLEFMHRVFYHFYHFSDASSILAHIPEWLTTCKSLSGSNLDLLVNDISGKLASVQRQWDLVRPQPEYKASMDVARAALMALGLSVPTGRHGSVPAGLLELAASDPDVQSSAAAFKALWAVAVSQHGLFPCLYICFASAALQHAQAQEIPDFLSRQLMLLPDAEKYIVCLEHRGFKRQGQLRPAVAHAVLEHLATIPSAMRGRVMISLLRELNLDSSAAPGDPVAEPRQPLQGADNPYPQNDCFETVLAQMFMADSAEQEMGWTEQDATLKRIIALLSTMDEAILKGFLGTAHWQMDSGWMATTYACLLDHAASMPLSSRKIIALRLLAFLSTTDLKHSVHADRYAGLIKRALDTVRHFPAPLKAESLYAVCTMYGSTRWQHPAWDQQFWFVLEECRGLPAGEQGRLLYALAGASEPTTLQRPQKLELLRQQAMLLDAKSKDAWTLLIDLKSVDPAGEHVEKEYANFVLLRERCTQLADPDQRSTVMLEIASLEAKFKKNHYRQNGNA